ncbi:MAG TPA: YraN family protein [Bacteroidales bacterium]|nr:YraN family protein [Bacteroidales bacterium]HNR40936.1 YraN family protein [Bacteroidales bacterium]HPM17882.1 YraN family protein [Bacteroidales bacterium]
MADSHNLGKDGEQQAAELLKKSGYTIRHRNWKSGKTELDIVAENNDFIVFVEVKTRTSDIFLKAADAVTPQKQKTIIFAADNYIRKYGIEKESRFDIITVTNSGDRSEIEHIENAFYPTLR